MAIAELHRKVPKQVRESEDALTGAAFGLMTLLPPERCLAPWLRRAVRLARPPSTLPGIEAVDAVRLDVQPLALPTIEVVDVVFWPTLGDDGDLCEPDALLYITAADGQTWAGAVEVKYRSGPSGWPTSAASDSKVRGQLGRQWIEVAKLDAHRFPRATREPSRRVLLYVTADTAPPIDFLVAVERELRAKGADAEGFRAAAYWLSWFWLAEIADGQLASTDVPRLERLALDRLVALLRARRLCAFRTICAPVLATPRPWSYSRRVHYPTRPLPFSGPQWTYPHHAR